MVRCAASRTSLHASVSYCEFATAVVRLGTLRVVRRCSLGLIQVWVSRGCRCCGSREEIVGPDVGDVDSPHKNTSKIIQAKGEENENLLRSKHTLDDKSISGLCDQEISFSLPCSSVIPNM